jgi:hypothetical protein
MRPALLALGSVLVVATACADDGDERRIPKAEWLRRADAICRDENAERRDLASPDFDPTDPDLSGAQLRAAARFLEATLMIADDTTAELDRLGLPDEDTDAVRDILDDRERGRRAILRAVESARAGDAEEFREGFGQASAAYAGAAEEAAALGLDHCGQ